MDTRATLASVMEAYSSTLALVREELSVDPGNSRALAKLRALTSGLETAVKAKIAWDRAEAEAAREMTTEAKLEAVESFLISIWDRGPEARALLSAMLGRVSAAESNRGTR